MTAPWIPRHAIDAGGWGLFEAPSIGSAGGARSGRPGWARRAIVNCVLYLASPERIHEH
jgi:hypothetical protein